MTLPGVIGPVAWLGKGCLTGCRGATLVNPHVSRVYGRTLGTHPVQRLSSSLQAALQHKFRCLVNLADEHSKVPGGGLNIGRLGSLVGPVSTSYDGGRCYPPAMTETTHLLLNLKHGAQQGTRPPIYPPANR